MIDNLEWLNSFGLYRQYAHIDEFTASKKLRKLIEKYGQFFDDTFFYYTPRGKNNGKILLRVPLWMDRNFGGKQVERHRQYRKGKQIKLELKA